MKNKMKKIIYILSVIIVFSAFCSLPTHAVAPVVTNVTASQREGSTTVDIYYDLHDTESFVKKVMIDVSTNSGMSYDIAASSLSGSGYSYGVISGTNLHITWQAGIDMPDVYIPHMQVRVTAYKLNIAFIPAGSFDMGDTFNDGSSFELPVHTVFISAFYMDKYEVTKEKWDEVYSWATANGYNFDNSGSGKGDKYPVYKVNWYDCIKWCNARSEKEGRTPCYYTDLSKTTIYKAGRINISNDWVNWEANGYRLPTEAEWEKAARGGTAGHRFSWTDTDTITHDRANYASSADYSYDVSPTRGCHPDYDDGIIPYHSPAGSFAPNGYGLYDMAANIWEWCWDWHGSSYYSNSPGSDPRGPASGTYRVLRSGGFGYPAVSARCSYRSGNNPDDNLNYYGFRCVCH
jgi:formylglycine-generating enzyme required for sulfatase activity